ncbi:MAG: UDP-3-O-(3-hydroxymyristoyl)glucosamine N-acyltransferase [Planctomycetales bacterium]|nr:UDP-3-O-(3-hydroxymyristoyl)glucosamine N-acyltransferase [Planctomycetales bacterium]
MPTAKLSELAALVGGTLSTGDDTEIIDALPLQDAYEGCLTLADHPKQAARVAHCPAAAVMLREAIPGCTKPMLIVSDLHRAFAQAIAHLRPVRHNRVPQAIHPTACVDSSSRVGAGTTLAAGVSIAENCVVGQRCVLHSGVQLMAGTHIGDDCVLFPHVTLYPDTHLGDRVLIHAGAVLGAYGFGYRLQDGRHERTAQLGWVDIGNDVEIGASTAIDRGTYGPTRIGDGTKIDNHVQIGHNCHIGKHNLICAQVGIAGSTVTGEHVVLAGQVGLADHIRLADRVVVGAQAGVMGNLEAGSVVVGSPAVPRRQRMVEWALIGRLPEMRKELKDMQQKINELEQQLADDGAPQRKCA